MDDIQAELFKKAAIHLQLSIRLYFNRPSNANSDVKLGFIHRIR